MILRGASWISEADLVRAMPSAKPQTTADKLVNQMHTTGNAPLPVAASQQKGGVFCPSCGSAHRAGSVCSKSIEDLFDVMKATEAGRPTVLRIPRPKGEGGNPNHDPATGKFMGAGGGGAPKSPKTAPSAGRPTTPAKTNQTRKVSNSQIESVESPPVKRAPAAKWSDKPDRGPITQAKQSNEIDRVAADVGTPMRTAEEKYQSAYDSARAGGVGHTDAHQQGKAAADQVFQNREKDRAQIGRVLENSPPDPRFRTAGQASSSIGSASTMPAPGGVPPATSSQNPQTTSPTSPSGQNPQVPPPGSTSGQNPSGPTGGGSSSAPTSRAGNHAQAGLIESAVKPWANWGTGTGIGGGMFSPGGTGGATAGAAAGGVHGVLNWAQQPKKPAADERAQRVQQISNQSGALQNQSTQHLNALRQFSTMAPQPPPIPQAPVMNMGGAQMMSPNAPQQMMGNRGQVLNNPFKPYP
jgi:hypothetical protein